MRLQSLEIKGFKSFANETVINFGADVIGIIGPNGSGKSNIVDAIRWVLGEQKSKELRLDQMSSVIFNGTKKRKPGGVASVSLTFENTKNLLPTEYQTVTITRMLYRTGESEYRLNGVPCRLKDITGLFLDTGIGSNSYAIIALGMVDDILSDKDNSRRKMFEQAAGISKYKVRKRQTLNKLKSTSEDLDRIEDLLYEINNNLVTLEKQAKRAKRYFEIKESYRVNSIDLAVLKINQYKEQQKQIRTQLTEGEDKYRSYEVQIKKLEANLEAVRKANVDKEKALSDSQRELNDLIGRIRALENEKRMLEQKEQFLTQNKEKASLEIQSASSKIKNFTESIENYRLDLQDAKREEARLEAELDKAEEALKSIKENHGSAKEELDAIANKQQEIERELFSLEKQKAVNLNEIDNYQRLIEQNKLDIEIRSKEVSSLRSKVDEIKDEESVLSIKLEKLQQAEENRLEQIIAAEKKLEDLSNKLTRLNRQLDAKRNEFKLTQSMIENLEGFPESIKFLSQNKDWKQEAAPLLSDIIYVNEEYRVAIENYLEPVLNYYVVKDFEAAQKAIKLLSRSQKGKANFFLLDAFKDYQPAINLLPGTQDAIDLVETDLEYRTLCSYLLENVVVTNSDDLGQQVQGNTVLLSKSGNFIKKKFSISGGSIGLFEGKKIGRKKNLEVLETTIQQLEREENRISGQYYQLKAEVEKLKNQTKNPDIQQLRQQISELAQNRVSFATRLENFESFLAETTQKFDESNAAIERLKIENEIIEKDLEEKGKAIEKIQLSIAQMDGSYRAIAEKMSQASTNFNEKNIAFIRQQNLVTSLQRELAFREKQLEEIMTTLETNTQQVSAHQQELFSIAEEVKNLERDLLERYDLRKEKEAALTDVEQAYFSARGGINEIEDELRRVSRLRQDTQILVNQLKEKYTDIKFKVTSMAQRLRIEFNIEINDALKLELTNPDAIPEELELKVEKARRRLENYGEINPMAMEAYDEMKERHDNISQQRDDIVDAKESLMNTIKEIEETATLQFLDSFSRARLYFIEVFRSLFTKDDNCDLILLEPDNPLESKIEIVAKPKGKRPQTISQLSGGEKTLTAIALLFALYLLKPAPFCIFDEVDAPLDDANIVKFNKIIKRFSSESQFIIVTHNKLTMAAVDTIYGVYMAEQGISGVAAVDFRDFEHSATFEAKA